MNLEVMLSVMNLKKTDLNKMNISSKCTVINQCKKNDFETYKNFSIYSYNEIGTSKSRNRALEHISEDIILLCDDDMIYFDDYEKIVLQAFSCNPNADMIIFNVFSPNRKKRKIRNNKRLHIYNSLNYGSYNIAFKRKSLNNISFNEMFGPNAAFSCGEDTLFIVDFLKNGLKIYSNTNYIGTVNHNSSTWFKGYDNNFFINKGALFSAISYRFRHLLFIQFLIRHKDVLEKTSFFKAYRLMKKGSILYKNEQTKSK